jgi:predicted 2-oxoglutarate/Fe(II)-dependent dioxygenase YbiX
MSFEIINEIGDVGLYIENCFDPEFISNIKNIFKLIDQKDVYNVRHATKINLTSKEYPDIISNIDKSAVKAINIFLDKHGIDKSNYVRFNVLDVDILTWKHGIGIGLHNDTVLYNDLEEITPRPDISILAYFSSEYEGGEIVFPDYNLSIHPNAGSIILFKAKTNHMVNEVISGTRMTTMANLYLKNRKDIVQIKETYL